MADNRRERRPTRARAYTSKVRFEEFSFETLSAYTTWHEDARAVQEVWQHDDFLLWITGNRLGVLPLYEELGEPGNDTRSGGFDRRVSLTAADLNTVVIQFDAHLDIYNLSDCTSELSHGNFLLHCDGPMPALINVGHRELLLRPEYIRHVLSDHVPRRRIGG